MLTFAKCSAEITILIAEVTKANRDYHYNETLNKMTITAKTAPRQD